VMGRVTLALYYQQCLGLAGLSEADLPREVRAVLASG